MPQVDKTLLARAKEMRKNPTSAEAKLWHALRAKRFQSFKFTHQVVIAPYIADFVARSYKLVIELDGDTHGFTHDYDQRRTRFLEDKGYHILRFTNSEVMANLDGVLQVILMSLLSSSVAPLPNSLPRGERE